MWAAHQFSAVHEELVEAGLGQDDLHFERDFIPALELVVEAAARRLLPKCDADPVRGCECKCAAELLEEVRTDRAALLLDWLLVDRRHSPCGVGAEEVSHVAAVANARPWRSIVLSFPAFGPKLAHR